MVFLWPNFCVSDTWKFEKEIKTEVFYFEEIKITRVIDTMDENSKPKHKLYFEINGVEEAIFKNLTFDRIVTFDNGNYFLGVSNTGFSQFAYFMLDKRGNLLRAVNHSKEIIYCEESVTIVREWVDSKDIDIREVYGTYDNDYNSGTFLDSVTIKSCSGDRIEIWRD